MKKVNWIISLLLASLGVLDAESFPPVPKPLPALDLPVLASSSARSHEITVQDLLELRMIGGLSISPDGQWVAFTLRQPDLKSNGYRTALFVTGTSGQGKLVNLGSVGPVVFSDTYFPLTVDPVWAQDSRYVFYPMRAVQPNGEFGKSQLFRWSREGGLSQQVTHSTTGVLYAIRAPDGKILYSTFGKRPDVEALTNRYFDHGIWYFDLESGPDSLRSISPALPERGPEVLDQALHHMRRLWEPATNQSLDDAPYEVHALDDPSGRRRDATAEEAKLYRKLAESHSIVSRWGTSLDDPSRVWIPGPTGAEISFQEEPHNGEDHSAPRNLKGHKLIYSVSRYGSKMRQVSPSSDYSYSECSYSTVAKRFACIRENPLNPPDIVSLNSDSSDEHVLTDLNPEVRTWKLPKVQLVEWTDSKGNPGFGYLYKPVGLGPGPYPTIVLPYAAASYDFIGQWPGSAVTENEYPTYAFTSRGYAVLRPDMCFYLVGNRSGTSKKLWMNEGSLASILSGLDRLVSIGAVDPTRVGIAGLSQGAKYVSYAIAHSHAFAAASVPTTVPSPLNSAGAYYASDQRLRDINAHGDDGQVIQGRERARLDESQLGPWPDSVSAALLVDASDAEWVWSVQAVIALRTRGKPVEMVVYPDAHHMKKWPRQLESVWGMNLDWFDFWLREVRDRSPEKKQQYDRWEKLKSAQSQTGQHSIY
jgi:dipeptidyl aminopeptidase/acylaminoacyl peptidase